MGRCAPVVTLVAGLVCVDGRTLERERSQEARKTKAVVGVEVGDENHIQAAELDVVATKCLMLRG